MSSLALVQSVKLARGKLRATPNGMSEEEIEKPAQIIVLLSFDVTAAYDKEDEERG